MSNVRHRLSKWVRNKIKSLKSPKRSEALNRAAIGGVSNKLARMLLLRPDSPRVTKRGVNKYAN